MEQMEEKLGAILNNPQMMQQIMTMAQSLGQSSPAPDKQNATQETGSPLPEIDISMLQRLSGFAQNNGIDKQQRALLSALSPYLSRDRVSKLEKAMRAAKLAKFASSFLGSGGLQLLSGR